MIGRHSQPVERAFAVTLLIAVLLVVWLAVIAPISSVTADRAELRGIALRALRRDRALLMQEPAIQAALVEVHDSPRWRNFYRGSNADTATVQLQEDLRAIFRSSNNPTSMVSLPPVEHGSITHLAAKVTLSMRADQLAEALERIQRATRHLEIDTLIVQSPDYQPPASNPILSIQAEIGAWMVTEPGEKQP